MFRGRSFRPHAIASYSDIKEDVVEEGGQFGVVKACEIPRPASDGGGGGDDVGKIFLEFDAVGSASKVQEDPSSDPLGLGWLATRCSVFAGVHHRRAPPPSSVTSRTTFASEACFWP